MKYAYHEGQLAVQKIAGEEENAKGRIPMIQSSLHERSIKFIEDQILAFTGTEDSDGAIWLSLLVGEQGFISVPSLHEIKFDLSKIHSTKEDIFFTNIKTNPIVGLLFHEAKRRARYRAWGTAKQEGTNLSFEIRMGYPSCPKHIQKESLELLEKKSTIETNFQRGSTLTDRQTEWIVNAHTFFIATQTKNGDIEASHRGGDPGFIELLENGNLRVPDYFGNSVYSTLGNIYENPKAALLFIDYQKGNTLQLTGTAKLEFEQNSKEDLYKSGDTGRFWTFETNQWIKTTGHHKLNAAFIQFSKYNVLTKKS